MELFYAINQFFYSCLSRKCQLQMVESLCLAIQGHFSMATCNNKAGQSRFVFCAVKAHLTIQTL
jgi:hypothetical protein